MLKKYREKVDRLHDYLCNDPKHPIIEIHHSHIDHGKLLRSRLISFIYISAIYLWVLWDMASITTNFIYLTLHGYFITWLFYTVILQDYFFIKVYGKENHPCPMLKHYIEIIYETALCFEFPITLVFWTFLFPILLKNNASTYDIVMNTNLHLGPIVCLLIELYYNNFSFPKKHLWVLAFYGTGYLMINLGNFLFYEVYSLAVKVIYQPIDWKSILSYALVIGCYVFVACAHYFGRYSYRKWKSQKYTHRITEGLIEEIEPQTNSTRSNDNQFSEPNKTSETSKNQNLFIEIKSNKGF